MQTFNFEKYTDAASAEMFKACCAGNHFPTAKVTLYKAGGDRGRRGLPPLRVRGSLRGRHSVVRLRRPIGIPTEMVSFSFGKVVVTYNQQDSRRRQSRLLHGILGRAYRRP